jgi:hypothetical protein
MTTEREAAEVIRSWMKEEVQLDDAGLHRVLARLPDTSQRKHRWPWPLVSHVGRNRTVFTPIRVAAGTAVVALSATLLLVGSMVQPPAQAPLPGAETADVSTEPAHFTGSASAWEATTPDTEVLPDRTIERWQAAWHNNVSDPRLTGRGEAMDYLETITGADGVSVLSHTGVGRLETDTGSWAVECQGAGSVDGGKGNIFCWYEGEEAHDGLTAFQVMTMTGDGTFDVEGWIFPGERPPLLDFED